MINIIFAILSSFATGLGLAVKPLDRYIYEGFAYSSFVIGFLVGYIPLGILYLVVQIMSSSDKTGSMGSLYANVEILVIIYSCGGWLVPTSLAWITKFMLTAES